jgi:hypothetical protein
MRRSMPLMASSLMDVRCATPGSLLHASDGRSRETVGTGFALTNGFRAAANHASRWPLPVGLGREKVTRFLSSRCQGS